MPGDNLRKSIFRDGLDKADVALIFFTSKSLQSSWVDREIKHVLREEIKKGNNFDLRKIISIFDSTETYEKIAQRYPELTDDLLHLMPENYTKIQLGQLVSAIWSKYLSLQGGDIETQRQMLEKDMEIFQKEKEIQSLKKSIEEFKSKNSNNSEIEEFKMFLESGEVKDFIVAKDLILCEPWVEHTEVANLSAAMAFGLVKRRDNYVMITDKGKDFFKWLLLNPGIHNN